MKSGNLLHLCTGIHLQTTDKMFNTMEHFKHIHNELCRIKICKRNEIDIL